MAFSSYFFTIISGIVATLIILMIILTDEANSFPAFIPFDCRGYVCDRTISRESCYAKSRVRSNSKNPNATVAPSKYRFLQQGGFCGCAICLRIIAENASCHALMNMRLFTDEQCDDTLRCDFSRGVCVRQ